MRGGENTLQTRTAHAAKDAGIALLVSPLALEGHANAIAEQSWAAVLLQPTVLSRTSTSSTDTREREQYQQHHTNKTLHGQPMSYQNCHKCYAILVAGGYQPLHAGS